MRGEWLRDSDGSEHAFWLEDSRSVCNDALRFFSGPPEGDVVCIKCVCRLVELDPNGELFVAPGRYFW